MCFESLEFWLLSCANRAHKSYIIRLTRPFAASSLQGQHSWGASPRLKHGHLYSLEFRDVHMVKIKETWWLWKQTCGCSKMLNPLTICTYKVAEAVYHQAVIRMMLPGGFKFMVYQLPVWWWSFATLRMTHDYHCLQAVVLCNRKCSCSDSWIAQALGGIWLYLIQFWIRWEWTKESAT